MTRRLRARSLRAVVLFVLVAAWFVYGFRMARVQGHSMEPTFHPGRWLLVRRLNWPSPPLRVGEVIVFKKDGEELVKRIVALPGERPPYDSEEALALAQSMARDEVPHFLEKARGLAAPVPPGQLYVVGDNLPVSDDSRAFGPIPQSTVLGRVLSWQEARDKWAPRRSARAP
jgi:signal peptidase I